MSSTTLKSHLQLPTMLQTSYVILTEANQADRIPYQHDWCRTILENHTHTFKILVKL